MVSVLSTFCFGERYRNQTNKLIESLQPFSDNILLFVVTDNEKEITSYPWVKVKNIKEYNPSYLNYKENYYDFDFSVKRYSLRFALENGHNKVALIDTDVLPGTRFSIDEFNNCFLENYIVGPVIYNFEKEINSSSDLGKRFMWYENYFKVNLVKDNLWMPEDCIQYIHIEKNKFKNFLDLWDKCIELKYENNLANVPAGNIDEMSFCASFNGIFLSNNFDKTLNVLTPKHEIWYR
jgi:hypothetical protein